MLLCIDAGNSGLKTALVERGTVVAFHRRRTEIGEPLTIRSLLPPGWRTAARRLEGTAVAAVVPKLIPMLTALAEEAAGSKALLVTNKIALPFSLEVRNPSRVGGDRIAAAAAAAGRAGGGAIIIDIGSAITVDLLSKGSFRGGIIMAGPGLSLRALNDHTARLPLVSLAARKNPLSSGIDETVRSMILGSGIGALGAVKEAVRELERRGGGKLPKYVTGGEAARLAAGMPSGWRYRPYLVMEGLYALWRLNNA